jgi:hypothetical protein
MKVQLQVRPPDGIEPPGFSARPIRQALPYYKAVRGTYVHRVRSGQSHYRDGKLSHIHVDFWCGGHGIPSANGELLASVEAGDVLCATCEGRAVGAGMDGVAMINGRAVAYSPRRRNG